MEITLEKLKQMNACEEGYDYVESLNTTDGNKIFKALIEYNSEWANWLIVRLLSRDNAIRYAIYAANGVLHIYEERYPDDKRPRKAINAAKKYLKTGNKDDLLISIDAADDAVCADRAADAVCAADSAAYTARAAHAAACVSRASAACVSRAAEAATYADVYTARAAKKMKIKIIKYGINLWKKEREKDNLIIKYQKNKKINNNQINIPNEIQQLLLDCFTSGYQACEDLNNKYSIQNNFNTWLYSDSSINQLKEIKKKTSITIHEEAKKIILI